MNIKKKTIYQLGKCTYTVEVEMLEDGGKKIGLELKIGEESFVIIYETDKFSGAPRTCQSTGYYFWDFLKIVDSRYWDISNIMGDGNRLIQEFEIIKLLNYFKDGIPTADRRVDGFLSK